MTDVHHTPSEQSRPSRRLPKYLIPVIICVAGVILFITIALAPVGIVVFIAGLIWAAVEYWIDRASTTETAGEEEAKRRDIG